VISAAPRQARPKPDVDELVRENLAIVGYQVNEMMARVPRHVHRDDLMSAGLAALAQAAMGYDATTGVPFARYASLRIRGALLDELRSMDWAPRGTRSRLRDLGAVEDRLTAKLGRRPDRSEVAAAWGTTPEEVDAVRGTGERSVLSMDAYEGVIAESLPHGGLGPEEQLLQDEQAHYLHASVRALPERLRAVVQGLFFDDRSAADLAAELDVSESRISQLRSEAVRLMRDGMNAQLEPALVEQVDRPGGVIDRRRQAYFAAVAANAASAPLASAPPAARPVPRQAQPVQRWAGAS